MPDTVTQLEIDQRVFDLYDEYCHGRIDRREFLRLAALVTGGLAMAQALLPRYAAGADHLLHRHPDQGAVRDLPVARRQFRTDAGIPGAAHGVGAVPGGAGDPRESRAQSLHRGRGAARRGRGLRGPRPRRPLPGRRLPRQRRRRARPAGRPRSGEAADRHAQQREHAQVAQALERQAGRDRLLLGRQHGQFPRGHDGRRPAGGRAVLRRGGRDRRRAEDQGAAADPVRRDRPAHQRDVARVRDGAEGRRACRTRCTSTRAPSTASTTTRRRATTKPRRNWRGTAPSPSSRSTWPDRPSRDIGDDPWQAPAPVFSFAPP